MMTDAGGVRAPGGRTYHVCAHGGQTSFVHAPGGRLALSVPLGQTTGFGPLGHRLGYVSRPHGSAVQFLALIGRGG